MEGKQTAEEALVIALRTAQMLSAPGSNWKKHANHLTARNVLHEELGRFSDEQPTYFLDEETRDRLLVHTRQDAAEALCHASSLMDEVHQLKSTLRQLRQWQSTIVLLFVVYLLWQWWKSGFAVPLWIAPH